MPLHAFYKTPSILGWAVSFPRAFEEDGLAGALRIRAQQDECSEVRESTWCFPPDMSHALDPISFLFSEVAF